MEKTNRFVFKSTFSGEVSVFSGLLIVGEEAEEATEEKQDSCRICGSFRQVWHLQR